jgi:hypothetical protein
MAIQEGNPNAIPSALPRSGNTVRAWLLTLFKEKQEYLRQSLAQAQSRVHNSFDLWSSGNVKAYLGLVGHWISVGGEKVSCLLGLKRLVGSHSGENQAEIVWSVLQEMDIQGKVLQCLC